MPKASTFLAGLFAPNTLTVAGALQRYLSTADAHHLRNALKVDCRDYLYSSCVSMLDALNGVSLGYYTWPTVKLYYSVFYSVRAILAANDVAIWYVRRSPLVIRAATGETSHRGKGQTHQLVLSTFQKHLGSHPLLSQPISGQSPIEWLMDRREDANYRISRFQEPVVPTHFQRVERLGLRRAIEAYLSDNTVAYHFDADHAIVAFPLAAFKAALKSWPSGFGPVISADDFGFISSRCKDTAGRLPRLHSLFEEFGRLL